MQRQPFVYEEWFSWMHQEWKSRGSTKETGVTVQPFTTNWFLYFVIVLTKIVLKIELTKIVLTNFVIVLIAFQIFLWMVQSSHHHGHLKFGTTFYVIMSFKAYRRRRLLNKGFNCNCNLLVTVRYYIGILKSCTKK